MSLTQNDLGHGFLYRRKDDPEVIGRLNFKQYDVETEALVSWKIGSSVVTTYMALEDWEGIPITPEILEDWYQAEGNKDMVEIRNKEISISCYTDIDGPSIRFASLTNPSLGGWVFTVNHVHDLQRLVLALTGKPLEGGPK